MGCRIDDFVRQPVYSLGKYLVNYKICNNGIEFCTGYPISLICRLLVERLVMIHVTVCFAARLPFHKIMAACQSIWILLCNFKQLLRNAIVDFQIVV